MNTYAKYCPNVWLAKTETKHEKGDIIEVANKYGDEKEHVVHNLIVERDGFFYYSITRADGFDSQERAKNRADKLLNASQNAKERSESHFQKSQRDAEFLSLGEPIKIGHHSEKRHRAMYENAWNQTGKAVEEDRKAKDYENRAEYWQSKTEEINLSMPESIEYYTKLSEEKKKIHEEYKNGTRPREHSYSLTYANKERKEAEDNLKKALILWS
jgi:hypothetical protein